MCSGRPRRDRDRGRYCRERNEPAHLVTVLDCIAHLRGMESAELAAATTANARRLFALEAA